jgi:hypothetical protein
MADIEKLNSGHVNASVSIVLPAFPFLINPTCVSIELTRFSARRFRFFVV